MYIVIVIVTIVDNSLGFSPSAPFVCLLEVFEACGRAGSRSAMSKGSVARRDTL
jgi:hypothetical protein